jgi:hypothetical protein
MMKLWLASFCLAALMLPGCSQMAADPAKTTANRPGTAQTQPPVSYAPSERSGGGGNDGGGGGGGGY